MKKTSILLSAALMFFGLTAKAQTTITFDTEDYAGIGVYDKWEESPFRTGELEGNAGVAINPSTTPDEVLGVAPNTTEKVVAFQRSRYGSNVYGVRIDLKEPIRVTKQLQYVHVMTYLKDKPTASRMMVIGLGRRLEASWSGQAGQDVEQFWSYTTTNVEPKDGWQDIVVSFKGFSYSKEENENSGIDLHALVIVPDVRTPDEDAADWVAYFDEIVVDGNPDKRFSTEQYALTHDAEAAMNRTDRGLSKVGLTSGGKTYESAARSKKFYSDNTTTSVFSVKAGEQVQPTFNYTGGWMSGYVYVDWIRDARFDESLNDDGTPAEGSDVVSYNALQIGDTWYKSDGTTRGDGNAIGQGVPAFTVPAGTAPGLYRMRYKVDWNSINPAGANDIITNGGGIVDLMLDVHGDEVTVNASQLNGDIRTANGDNLISYSAGYEQPFKVKIDPAPGFVQYGFSLKYGYNVSAKEQLDDKGNPNWIEVNVPYTEIAGDGTYTIPAEYMRGSQVSIEGDMQQVQPYTVEVVGLEGQGGVVYANIETAHEGTVNATQFFTVEQVEAIAVEGYTASVTLNDRVITVTYRVEAEPYREVTSLTELKNYKLYQIKAKSGEGYLAWNETITNDYISLRGVTNTSHNNEPSEANVANIYKEAVSPFDETVVWQIISEDGKYYLYHPARNAYMTRDGRDYKFTETKTALDAIHGNDDGSFAFHAGGGYSNESTNFACIVTNENQIAVRNWTSTDHGSKMQIIENPNVYTLEYTVEVVGGVAGGITLEGAEYTNGAKVMSTQFLTAADVTAKAVAGYDAEVSVDVENSTIRVTYSVDEYAPVVVTAITEGKFYTLQCKATDHGTFIKDDGTNINGRSSEGSFFVFEPGTATNTYYIKSVISGKYINANGNAVTVDVEKNTAWVLNSPSHSTGWVTFEDGITDNFLNNNQGSAPYLKANHHDGGPGSGNACSLWKMTQYPFPTTDPDAVVTIIVTLTDELGNEYINPVESSFKGLAEVLATKYPAFILGDTPSWGMENGVYTYANTLTLAPEAEGVTSITEGKLYTLECRSDAAHSTTRFIGVTEDGKISGQSGTAAFIQFEKDNEENGYYIKVVNANKYLNHNGSNISASAEKSTVWTLGVPTHTANVVTFTIGNDKYLNNNGSDCNDGTCVSLKANPHDGGPGSGNACSLWKMTQYPDPTADPEIPEEDEEEEELFVMPEEGKYYKLKGDNAAGMPWLTDQLNGSSIVVSAEEADAAVFKKTANGLMAVVKGKYLGMSGDVVSLVDSEANVTIGEYNDNNATGEGIKYSVKVSNNYMYNNNSDGKTHESSGWIDTIERYWGFVEVDNPGVDEEAVLAQWKESVLPYLGYVGGYPADLRDEIEAVQTLAEKEAFEVEHEVLSINADTYYRLVCVSPKTGNNGDTSYNTLTFDRQDNLVTRPTNDEDGNQLFRFEDAGNGNYYLKNINANAYLNKIAAGDYRSKVVAKDEACKLDVSLYEGTVIQWRLHNSESVSGHNYDKHCLFAENHPTETKTVPYACAGWDGGANSASAWYIVPVNNFGYTLNVTSAGYATLYLDCAVAIPEDIKVYIAESVAKDEDGDRLMMTLVTGVLPAETGVIVRANPGRYSLMQSDGEPSVDVTGNMLKGTFADEYIRKESGIEYYVLANKEGVGMYKPALNENDEFKNNANKAYLEVNLNKFGFQEGSSDTQAPGGQLTNKLRFDFGGTTSIEKTTDNGQQTTVIYDLMGRRVEKMEKGIYIVNGKKVIF